MGHERDKIKVCCDESSVATKNPGRILGILPESSLLVDGLKLLGGEDAFQPFPVFFFSSDGKGGECPAKGFLFFTERPFRRVLECFKILDFGWLVVRGQTKRFCKHNMNMLEVVLYVSNLDSVCISISLSHPMWIGITGDSLVSLEEEAWATQGEPVRTCETLAKIDANTIVDRPPANGMVDT